MAAVTFLRQLASAAVVVTVVVLGGLAWSHLAPSLPGEGPAGHTLVARGHLILPAGKPPPGAKPPPGSPGMRQNDGSGIPPLLAGDLLEPVNLVVLRDSAVLEAAVMAAVVLVDAGNRRLRRARRTRS